jgi:antitoxin CptB
MTQTPPDAGEIRRRRLLFRATHRGTHENDLIIGGFVARRINTLTSTELEALEEIMELPDAALADWLTGRAPIPPENDSPMLRRIRDAAKDAAGTAP